MSDPSRDLGHILDTLAFKAFTPQQIAHQIADKVGTISSWSYPRSRTERIKQHVDRLAERYGNLGVSRRKMTRMVIRILHRRDNRQTKARRIESGNQDA